MTRLKFEIAGVLVVAVVAMAVVMRFAPPSLPSPPPPAAADVVAESNPISERARSRVQHLKQPQGPKVPISAHAMKTAVTSAAEESISRLKLIRSCEKSPNALCPVNHVMARTSPDGYDALLVEQTVGELAFLKALAEDARQTGRPLDFSVGNVAAAYIRHRNDDVRERALELAALLTVSEPKVVVEVASRAVQTTVSGPLAVRALDLLASTREANPRLVDQTVLQALRTGGWDVRDAVAERILPFVTRENRGTLERILAKTPIRSKRALHLRLNLEEFDRMERL